MAFTPSSWAWQHCNAWERVPTWFITSKLARAKKWNFEDLGHFGASPIFWTPTYIYIYTHTYIYICTHIYIIHTQTYIYIYTYGKIPWNYEDGPVALSMCRNTTEASSGFNLCSGRWPGVEWVCPSKTMVYSYHSNPQKDRKVKSCLNSEISMNSIFLGFSILVRQIHHRSLSCTCGTSAPRSGPMQFRCLSQPSSAQTY